MYPVDGDQVGKECNPSNLAFVLQVRASGCSYILF